KIRTATGAMKKRLSSDARLKSNAGTISRLRNSNARLNGSVRISSALTSVASGSSSVRNRNNDGRQNVPGGWRINKDARLRNRDVWLTNKDAISSEVLSRNASATGPVVEVMNKDEMANNCECLNSSVVRPTNSAV